MAHKLSLWNCSIFYWPKGNPYGTLIWLSAITMKLFYLLLTNRLTLLYYIIFYSPTGYPYGTLLSSTGPQAIPLVLYCPTGYSYDTLLSSVSTTDPQAIPMVLYYFNCPLTIPLILLYILLANRLSLRYSSIFYWPIGYPYGTPLFQLPTDYPFDTLLSSISPQAIPMILYNLLLAHRLSLWYSTIFDWRTDNSYGTHLTPTGQ